MASLIRRLRRWWTLPEGDRAASGKFAALGVFVVANGAVSSLAWRNCAVGLCRFLLGSFGRKIKRLCPTKRGNMQACETNMLSVDAQVNAASTDAAPASGASPARLSAAAATSAAAGVNAAVASGAAVSPREVASLRPNQRTRRVNVGGVPMAAAPRASCSRCLTLPPTTWRRTCARFARLRRPAAKWCAWPFLVALILTNLPRCARKAPCRWSPTCISMRVSPSKLLAAARRSCASTRVILAVGKRPTKSSTPLAPPIFLFVSA